MAFITIPNSADKIFLGEEATYGTAATTAFATHVEGSAAPKLSQTEIENNAASARLFQRFASIQGLKSGDSGIAFSVHARPAAVVLDTGATPATPYLGTAIKALVGGEYSAAGSTVSGGSATTTSVPVQTGHGSRFRVGTVVAVEVSSVRYFRVVSAIATDTLTVWPELPGAPANSDDVLNGYCYFPTQSNDQSLTIEHTHTVPASSGAETVQRRLLGCTGGLSFTAGQDALASWGFDLKAADWEYGSLSLSTAVGTETMGDPMAVTSLKIYLQAAATTTDSHYCASSFGATFDTGMTHLKCLGGIQGTSGTARMGGRNAASFSVRAQIDLDRYTEWNARTLLRLLAILESGSGNSKRATYLYSNRVQIVGNPQPVEEGGFVYQDLALQPVLDASQTVDTAAGAPWCGGFV